MSTVALRELATGERIHLERKPGENWRITRYWFVQVWPVDRYSGWLRYPTGIPESWTGLEFETPDAGRDFVLQQVVQGRVPRNRPAMPRA